MSYRKTLTGIFSILLTTVAVWAMPPHPDLLKKIRSGEIATPYFMQHERELRARGVEAPHRARIDSPTDKTYFPTLIILVDFSDHPATTNPSFYDSLFYGHSNHTVNHFYNEVSYGDFHVVTANYPSVIGWVRAPQPYSYYVDGQHGFGNYPHNAQRLTEDVVNAVNSRVDFSHYAHSGDVEGLFIVHSGRGAEVSGSNNDIWSHAWGCGPVTLDGVTVSRYSMEPEFQGSPGDLTCGVFCHEMGHAIFGLPDLYDTDYSSAGIGDWSLMAGGDVRYGSTKQVASAVGEGAEPLRRSRMRRAGSGCTSLHR